jgi:NAD-dependent dihydropyrimidine dehydrogenase PreA subunit
MLEKKVKKKKAVKLSTARKKCLAEFQRYCRMRDADLGGYARCISCGRIYDVKNMDGGHYEGRQNRAVEIEEDNCHAQCKACNGPMQGNTVAYRMRLIERIGQRRVLRIEAMAMAYKGSDEAMATLSEEDKSIVTMKRTAKWYLDKAKEFKAMADELAKEKGIA